MTENVAHFTLKGTTTPHVHAHETDYAYLVQLKLGRNLSLQPSAYYYYTLSLPPQRRLESRATRV